AAHSPLPIRLTDTMDLHHDILEAAFPGEQARYYLPISIGGHAELADQGAALILSGVKTATSSPYWDYPDGRIPFVGALSVLLDGRGEPVAIVQTVSVEPVRFADVTDTMAWVYGEGERTRAWWLQANRAWYRDKAARDGQVFSEDDPILWETIEVVRRLAPAPASVQPLQDPGGRSDGV
ncbi:ASCH domain-containing protein, partial [Escherichia coli]